MQGFSKIFNKIIEKNKVLSPTDLTADQKKRLYDLMTRYGGTQSLAYERFFQRGFKQWEVIGIDRIKADFLREHEAEITEAIYNNGDANTPDTPVSGHLYKMVTMYNRPGAFYAMISLVRMLRQNLKDLMSDLGMTGDVTVIKRFNEDNWKEWERRGVRAVFTEFLENEERLKAEPTSAE